MTMRACFRDFACVSVCVCVGAIVASAARAQETEGGSLSQYYPSESKETEESTLPPLVVDAIWRKIDDNQDGRATDREAYAAIAPVRVIANSKKASELRDALRQLADLDNNDLVSKKEALSVIGKVRGAKCPTAKAAQAYFARLDQNSSGSLEPNEMRGTLLGLGKVGVALFQPVGITVKNMDLNGNNAIDADEIAISANAMMRVKLATDGPGIARRDPQDWIKFVNAIAYMDIDADNQVSPVEAQRIAAIGRTFGQIDKNRNRHVSIGELCEYQEKLDLEAYLSSSVGGS